MIEKLKRINDYKFEIPVGSFPGMRVPAWIFMTDELYKTAFEEDVIRQVVNASTLPGIVKASIAMPDIHYGYGLPIGGVVATDWYEGIVSPGGVGYDINCGVRLIKTDLEEKDILKVKDSLLSILFKNIPSGVGSTGKLKLTNTQMEDLIVNGSKWAVENGFGESLDLERTESSGKLEGADPYKVSKKAFERGKKQIGTLGSGNHFLEVQVVDEIFDKKKADTLGLVKGKITIMIHTGSRGFGHQVASDYIDMMESAIKKYKIELPDRELACAPIQSKEGQDYLKAMASAANFAWVNRQVIMHWVRESFEKVFRKSYNKLGMKLIYDHAHNIVKKEEHKINGRKKTVAVHRKGATRAFPPNHPEIPDVYKEIGQPVLIPGDMGRYSYVLTGTERAMEESFGTSCHGAGRVLSRHKAIKKAKGRSIEKELKEKGIFVRSDSRRTIMEEMPEAYKDVSLVVDTIEKAGISVKVAKLRPLLVVKG